MTQPRGPGVRRAHVDNADYFYFLLEHIDDGGGWGDVEGIMDV